MKSLCPLVLSLLCQSLLSQEEIRGFDLSGSYYYTKNQHNTKSGEYLLANYEKAVESSLNEIDNTFEEIEDQIEQTNKLDMIELILLITIYITVFGVIFAIKTLCSKNNKLEKSNLAILPLVKNQSERQNFKTLFSMMNTQPATNDDKRFIEI